MAAQRTIGIDVGGTKILAGVVERDGTVLRTERRETPVESTQAFLEGLAEVVDALRDDSVAAVGIGIPSTIDQRNGSSVFSVHVPIEGLPLRERGERYLGLPVAIDNDANAAAVGRVDDRRRPRYAAHGHADARHRHRRRAHPRRAALPWIERRRCRARATWCSSSTGLSAAGLLHGARPLRGFASGSAANELADELFGPESDSRQLVAAARDGDERAVGALAGMGRKLGAGMASLVNIFDPEVIVIGGGFGDAFDLLLEPALETLRRDALPPGRDRVRVLAAELGEEAGMVGAGLIAFETLEAELVPLAVCATPIGNLEDVTLRVLRELSEADVVLCEDTRRTRTLLSRHGISARLLSYHEHNEAKRTAELLPRLVAGERMALVSDAGLPGMSDPGQRLVAAAIEAGVPVTVLPGASAVETALVASGFRVRALPVRRLPAEGGAGAGAHSGRSSRPGRTPSWRSSRRSACRRRSSRS